MSDRPRRIGVFVCLCGTNIADKVDVEAVAEYAAELPGVVTARTYQYMCSDPGQDLVKEEIEGSGLNRVVVASCSPLMHELTFRRACEDAGLNPFNFQMANIREQVASLLDGVLHHQPLPMNLARASHQTTLPFFVLV